MSGLNSKRAFITGASGGIGRAAAIELARRGARVAIHCFRNRAGAEETAAAVAAASPSGGKVTLVVGDLSRPRARTARSRKRRTRSAGSTSS